MGNNPYWTKEEDLYLSDAWGERSIATISKNLGRSHGAILNRKIRLGLGPFLMNGDYVSLNQLIKGLRGETSKVYTGYKDKYISAGLPVKTKVIGTSRFKIVRLNEFWTWAEKNKRVIDFSKMEQGIFGEEPGWVKKKRAIDFECRLKITPWTQAEDRKLLKMLIQYRYTYTDIASGFNRTEGAIKRRICTLGYKERPIKAENRYWTDEEIQVLKTMYEDGWSFEKIGQKLHRSALGCRGRMERIEHPEYFKRQYRNNRESLKPFFQKDMCRHYEKIRGCILSKNNCDECLDFKKQDRMG